MGKLHNVNRLVTVMQSFLIPDVFSHMDFSTQSLPKQANVMYVG